MSFVKPPRRPRGGRKVRERRERARQAAIMANTKICLHFLRDSCRDANCRFNHICPHCNQHRDHPCREFNLQEYIQAHDKCDKCHIIGHTEQTCATNTINCHLMFSSRGCCEKQQCDYRHYDEEIDFEAIIDAKIAEVDSAAEK